MGQSVLTSISAFKQTLTGGAFESLAAVSGDSLSVLYFSPTGAAFVEEIITGNSTQRMEVAIFSPRFGDNQFGFRAQHMFNPTTAAPAGPSQLLMPRELDIPIFPSDALSVSVNAPAAAGNANLTMQAYYTVVPGAGQRLATWEAIQGIGWVRVLGIETTVTPRACGRISTTRSWATRRTRQDSCSAFAGRIRAGSTSRSPPRTTPSIRRTGSF